jgi:hypothetical protein
MLISGSDKVLNLHGNIFPEGCLYGSHRYELELLM